MKLCYDQIEKMKQHLVEHNLKACAICGKEEWAFSDKLYALTEFNPDPLILNVLNCLLSLLFVSIVVT